MYICTVKQRIVIKVARGGVRVHVCACYNVIHVYEYITCAQVTMSYVCIGVCMYTTCMQVSLPSKGEVVIGVENFPVHPFTHLIFFIILLFVEGIHFCSC